MEGQQELPYATTSEDSIIQSLIPVAEAVSSFLGEKCEVVVHDVRTPESSIVAIFNGHITGRRKGGPILGGPTGDMGFKLLNKNSKDTEVATYSSTTRDGRPLKSSSVIFRDPVSGDPFAAFCINFDVSQAKELHQFLDHLISHDEAPSQASTAEVESDDIDTLLDQMIHECIGNGGESVEAFSKQERLKVVECLLERGVFMIRGAHQRVATALGVSKFTIYNYLDELRSHS